MDNKKDNFNVEINNNYGNYFDDCVFNYIATGNYGNGNQRKQSDTQGWKIIDAQEIVDNDSQQVCTTAEEADDERLDSIFNDALDMNAVKEGIRKIIARYGDEHTKRMREAKDWFIVYKVLEEIDWVPKRKGEPFIRWVEHNFGWSWGTRDFKHLKQEFKKTPSYEWNGDTTAQQTTGKVYREMADYVRDTFATIGYDGTIKDRSEYLKRHADGTSRFIHHKSKIIIER
ncbi:MAG: hypothetical protein Q4D41_11940 [Prevotellaceae bacterium]|nr:hypothetical protein [Prevotellaceae bacterium]